MAVVETSADHAEPRAEEPEAGAREMRDLEDLLSKLNPMAEEFVPPSLASPVGAGLPPSPAAYGYYPANAGFAAPSPAAHRGVVGFPFGRGARVRVLRQVPGFALFSLVPMSAADVMTWWAVLPAEERGSGARRPRPPRQAPEQQPHHHGAARRGHPPHRLRLRHRSPGQRADPARFIPVASHSFATGHSCFFL
jgi:hypothetical protein